MKIAIIDKSTHKIVCKYKAESINYDHYAGPYSKPELYAHVEIPSNLEWVMIAELSVEENNGEYTISLN